MCVCPEGYVPLMPRVSVIRNKPDARKRVIKGHSYELFISKTSSAFGDKYKLKIVDENGKLLEPSLSSPDRDSSYWTIIRNCLNNGTRPLSGAEYKQLINIKNAKKQTTIWVKHPDGPEYYLIYECINNVDQFVKDQQYKFCVETQRVYDHANNPVHITPDFWDNFELINYGNLDASSSSCYTLIGTSNPDKITNNPEEKTMKVEITTPTLVNGTDAQTMSDSDIIHILKEVETAIEKLEKVKTKSKRIAAIIKEHQTNAARLVEILDAREPAKAPAKK